MVAVRQSAWAIIIQKCDQAWRPTSRMAHLLTWQASAGCQQEASVLHHEDLAIGLLERSDNVSAGFSWSK